MQICPLCISDDCVLFFEDDKRPFYHCPICSLVFVPQTHFLSASAEKAEYDLHQNSPTDLGYRRFLSRLFLPMQERLAPNSLGLDFGSGPGPTLSLMFKEVGQRMEIYDPFYAPETAVFNNTYDFITATEVVEHLHKPKKELYQLWSLLKPSGTLGIMTKLMINQEAFAKWHYKNDLTHVCFFSQKTFIWLATQWQAELTFLHNDVILLQKANLTSPNLY
ncbi:MAG: class I SAM-dependent methyltransferase [Chloroflexi bacterium]|nr:class I SAM-dependent methyltransferase [Chloroflexota bacterium]